MLSAMDKRSSLIIILLGLVTVAPFAIWGAIGLIRKKPSA
jgi:hypothetical protein